MNISIKTIPHAEQKYPTVGDWRFEDNGDLTIRISSMNNWKHELLVAFHEIAEVALCMDRNIATETVDAFDMNFEVERAEGKHGVDDEPGDSKDAPYRKEHFFATNVERMLAAELGVDWDDYNKAVVSL